MKKIFILTGEIHSGKTTRLMKWSANRKNVDGIFQPVIDDKRFIYHLAAKTLKPLETDSPENIVQIGKYKFSNQTFDWAKTVLAEAVQKEIDWLIIDEIGPLELSGKALDSVISKIFFSIDSITPKIICVVRSGLVEDMINHYGLKDRYELFDIPSKNLQSL